MASLTAGSTPKSSAQIATSRSMVLFICAGLLEFITCASFGLAFHEKIIASTWFVCHGWRLRINRALARCGGFGLTSTLGTLGGQRCWLAASLCGFLYRPLSTDIQVTTCWAWQKPAPLFLDISLWFFNQRSQLRHCP
jgi:hypothetical protein